MTTNFCYHLDAYGAQYIRTETAYRQCVHLMERILATGFEPGLPELVTQALADWAAEDEKLRDMLVAEVEAGRVRVPRALVRAHKRRSDPAQRKPRRRGRMICAACRCALPRLSYPEWEIAHNGVVAFRGEELPLPAPVAV